MVRLGWDCASVRVFAVQVGGKSFTKELGLLEISRLIASTDSIERRRRPFARRAGWIKCCLALIAAMALSASTFCRYHGSDA